jgi:hypothetical protein
MTPLTLSRKQALMPIPTLKQRELREPAYSRPHQQPVPEETATTAAEPDESLVADPRASLSPAQIVDQRLLALLGSGNPGLYVQASGRPEGVRRQTGE